MNKEKALMSVMEHDFLVTDLQLFLDTHPDDAQAVKAFNDAVKQASEARERYERVFGPLSKLSGSPADTYTWMTPEWPWQVEYTK